MKETTVTLRFLAEPVNVNFGGKVHGGSVMKWIDQAGYACAANWCRGYAVTVYVGGIRFYKPMMIGYLVELRARLIHTGNSSMHISVDVFSKSPETDDWVRNTHCIIIFVSLDKAGKPINVPVYIPSSDEERQLQQYAIRLMELRKGIEEEMETYLS
jgi:hypothetical protein